MRKFIMNKIVVGFLLALGCGTVAALPAVAQSRSLVDVGGEYNYVRTNTPADNCGCFNLNGGSGWIGFNFNRSFGIVGEVASQHASNISSSGADLTLTSYLAGPRYTWGRSRHVAPYAQVLVGGAHASGSLAPGNSGLPGASNTFGMTAGGGWDIGLSRHLSLRAFEAAYYLTRFENGTNDHQNNLRLGAGLMIRFGESR